MAVYYLSFSSSALPAILIHLDFVQVFLSVEKHCIVFYFQTLESKKNPRAALFRRMKFTLCPVHMPTWQQCRRNKKISLFINNAVSLTKQRFVGHNKPRAGGMAERLFLSTRETLCFVWKFFAVWMVSSQTSAAFSQRLGLPLWTCWREGGEKKEQNALFDINRV